MGIFDFMKKTSPVSTGTTKGKNPTAFDYKKERELLSEYNKRKVQKDKSFEYFAALPMIDFYYKFRNLDRKYLDECIKYCNICISLLSSHYMKDDILHEINIPAIKRLFIIYKNEGDYMKALEMIKLAEKYAQEPEYFKKQKAELLKKIK